MNLNKFLNSLFGDKSTRDMKLIQPLVEKVKAVYPDIQKLSNDELRAKTKEIQSYVQDAGKPYREKIAELKAKIEDTPIDERAIRFIEAGGTLMLTMDAGAVDEMVDAVLARAEVDPAFAAEVDEAVRTALTAKARAGLLGSP